MLNYQVPSPIHALHLKHSIQIFNSFLATNTTEAQTSLSLHLSELSDNCLIKVTYLKTIPYYHLVLPQLQNQ